MIFNHPISQRPLQKNLFVFENELFRDYLYGVRKLDGGNNDRELINMVKICKTYSIADFFFFFFVTMEHRRSHHNTTFPTAKS